MRVLAAVDEEARQLAEGQAAEDVAGIRLGLPLVDDALAQRLAQAFDQPLLVLVALGDQAAHDQLERARRILANLEGGELNREGFPNLARGADEEGSDEGQLALFAGGGAARDPAEDRVLEELRALDPDHLTPVDALVALNAGGGVSVLGATSSAIVDATAGNVLINTPGSVLIAAGLDPEGDALVVADGGAGLVEIRASECLGCVLLGGDPFQSPVADSGAFAGALNVIFPEVPVEPPVDPVAPPVDLVGPPVILVDGESDEVNTDEVLALLDLQEELFERGSAARVEEDEEDRRREPICR